MCMKLVVLIALVSAFALSALAQGPHSADAKKAAKTLAQLGAKSAAAKSALAKHPKDPNLKHSYLAVNDKYAYATMTADGLTPHEKYAGALHIYRQSLRVDPSDADARKWVKMIEDIYTSMHRPIPKG